MDTVKPGKTRAPRRDARAGSGLLIRPHVGAETRVKSGGRAERATATDESVLSDTSGDARSDQASDALRDANR